MASQIVFFFSWLFPLEAALQNVYLSYIHCNITYSSTSPDAAISFVSCQLPSNSTSSSTSSSSSSSSSQNFTYQWATCGQTCCQNYHTSSNDIFNMPFLNACSKIDTSMMASDQQFFIPGFSIGIIIGVIVVIAVGVGCLLHRYFQMKLNNEPKEQDQLEDHQKDKITTSLSKLIWIENARENQERKSLVDKIEIKQITLHPIHSTVMSQLEHPVMSELEHPVMSEQHPSQLNFIHRKTETEVCSICLNNEVKLKLNCGHMFHSQCQACWLAKSHQCPLCKRDSWSFMRLYCTNCNQRYLLFRPEDFVMFYQQVEKCNKCSENSNKNNYSISPTKIKIHSSGIKQMKSFTS